MSFISTEHDSMQISTDIMGDMIRHGGIDSHPSATVHSTGV
jgi:hypothetical protein